MATHSVFLPGESPGQRSLVGYSPWGHKESDTTERLSVHARKRRSKDVLEEVTLAHSRSGLEIFVGTFCLGDGSGPLVGGGPGVLNILYCARQRPTCR